MDQSAEDGAAPYPYRGEASDWHRGAVVVIRRLQVPCAMRAMLVVVRGALV
jgi:hypothetical protein